MKKDSKKDSAVSPVIGTILLVAITVVLVAIISAVVMGMSGNVGHTYTVGVKVTNNATTTNVMFTGGEYTQIESWSITNATSGTGPSATGAPAVGTTYNTPGVKITGDCVMIAKFSTGNQTIWSGYLA